MILCLAIEHRGVKEDPTTDIRRPRKDDLNDES